MTRQYFGTDGIRGRVGDTVINVDFFQKLGWAIGQVLGQSGENNFILGRDTRESGPELQAALQSGLIMAGCHVHDGGILPTPAVAYLTRTQAMQAGIVVSASHNPFYDNGIKLFDSQGMKLSDEAELEIEAALTSAPDSSAALLDGITQVVAASQRAYIDFCCHIFPEGLALNGLHVVVDGSHGAMSSVAPITLRELGAQVTEVGCEPDGKNINVGCGSLHPEVLQEQVMAAKADLGIAFDGDGDRLLLVAHDGVCVDGDEILCILASDKSMQTKGIVGTLMSNIGLEQALQARAIPFERAKVGDRYVLEKLLALGWQLGGENSGHVIDLEFTTTGDGLLTVLQVLRAMKRQGATLSSLRQQMIKRPQILKNVHYQGDAQAILLSDFVVQTRHQLEAQLADRGRILLRLSGTEPVIRVMAEGSDKNEVTAVVDTLVKAIEAASGLAH